MHSSRTWLATAILCLPLGCTDMAVMNGEGTPMNGDTPNNDMNMDGADTPGNQDPDAPAGFTIQGDTARMIGTIGPTTPDVVRSLINDNPGVTTIVMVDVPGSEDDESNLEAARLVRGAGLNTHIEGDGEGVASGGTDFFLAGTVRTMDAGAIVGVHSWATGDAIPIQGGELKNNDPDWETDPEHTTYTDYYREIGLADPNGFYCFTLEAAPAEDIYNMTTEEKNRFGMCTPDPCP